MSVREGEAALQLIKRTHPHLQGGSLRVCPTSPTPSTHTHTHTHTHTRLGFHPGLQLLGHVHVFPAPICGDRSEGGTATPKGGQVTQRMREQEDTQAEGEGATGGRGLETPTPGWHESKDGGGGKRDGGRDGRPQEGARKVPPLTQRCVGTLLTLRNIHVIFPRLH